MRTTKRFGWIPDLPDQRDRKFAAWRDGIQLAGNTPLSLMKLPFAVSLRPNAGPIYDQGNIGSCTAQAIAAAIVYEEKKQKLPELFPSRLFIYYNERVIEGTVAADAGASIRDGIKSVVNRGVCSETEFGYEHAFDDRPWDSCYAHAKMDLVKQYLSLDPDLNQMQTCLAAGFPFIVGFTVYDSFESAAVASSGHVPMPGPSEQVIGGHAVLCLGYDNASQTFLCQNSWGTGWGMQGFFTIPYAYLTDSNLAGDFWSIRMV
jgi:C1A family cysteine protease